MISLATNRRTSRLPMKKKRRFPRIERDTKLEEEIEQEKYVPDRGVDRRYCRKWG
jgi:hypothetical protein